MAKDLPGREEIRPYRERCDLIKAETSAPETYHKIKRSQPQEKSFYNSKDDVLNTFFSTNCLLMSLLLFCWEH